MPAFCPAFARLRAAFALAAEVAARRRRLEAGEQLARIGGNWAVNAPCCAVQILFSVKKRPWNSSDVAGGALCMLSACL